MTLARLGLDCRLYYNAGAINAPLWAEIVHVKDLTLNLQTAEADVSTRGTGGWRAIAQTLKELEISFVLQAVTGDPNLTILRQTWEQRDSLDVMVLDGDRTEAGSQGVRALVQIVNFTRNENLEEGVTYNVVMKGTLAIPATWVVIA